jgi:ankyrin repeat protein
MLNFKEWLLINETKQEKDLASELAGDALTDLSTVIPQKDKNADKLLLLAAYYYSQNRNKAQVKTDMTAYIGYLNRDKMKMITVDLNSKKPPSPWDNYLHWTEVIHGHQADDADKERSKFNPSQDDFQNERPILISPDGKIKVYESNNTEKCIILGKGQRFCISKPGNKMWQSYRDRDTSSFYFVYDDTRNDRLSIVVVDARPNRIVLTDKLNKTGTTLDPYTRQLTNDSQPYMRYLREKGIDVSKIVNIPKSAEEEKEQEELGDERSDLDWFKSLSFEYKSKYIGRGHLLTNEQFDYLWDNKFTSLLTQYAKTGLLLDDYQIDKIATNRDLKDNYIYNRIINDREDDNLTKKEYSLMNLNQKESFYEKYKENNHDKLDKAISFGDLDYVKHLADEKGVEISYDVIGSAIESGNLNFVKYLVDEKGFEIHDIDAVASAAISGDLSIVKYFVDDKKVAIGDKALEWAAEGNHVDIVKYLINKGAPIGSNIVYYAAGHGDLDFVKYLVDEKGATIDDAAVGAATRYGYTPIVKYLVDDKGATISDNAIYHAAKNDNSYLVKYFIKKGGKISENAVNYIIQSGDLDLVKYIVDEKSATLGDDTVDDAVKSGNLDLVKYIVDDKNKPISEDDLLTAARFGHLPIVKYFIHDKGQKADEYVLDRATRYRHQHVVNYLNSVMNKN